MADKLYIDAQGKAGDLADWLDEKGYRYGYNGRPCQRRSPHNMPFITIDVVNGFYSGSKGADMAVTWRKLDQRLVEQLLMKLPDINEIHNRARKNDRPIDNNMRQPSADGRKMERFWITATNRPMPISSMKDDHLHNTILMVDRTIDAGQTQIGGNRDLANLLDELEDERIHRGLHLPLVPFKSIEYRKGTHHDKY